MTPLLAVVYALTVYRLTRLVVSDGFPPIRTLRESLLARWPSDDTLFTSEWVTHTGGEPESLAGAELFAVDAETWAPVKPHWFGDLITCMWCTSVWVAALSLPVFWLWPDVMLWVGLVPAASAVTGLLGDS